MTDQTPRPEELDLLLAAAAVVDGVATADDEGVVRRAGERGAAAVAAQRRAAASIAAPVPAQAADAAEAALQRALSAFAADATPGPDQNRRTSPAPSSQGFLVRNRNVVLGLAAALAVVLGLGAVVQPWSGGDESTNLSAAPAIARDQAESAARATSDAPSTTLPFAAAGGPASASGGGSAGVAEGVAPMPPAAPTSALPPTTTRPVPTSVAAAAGGSAKATSTPVLSGGDLGMRVTAEQVATVVRQDLDEPGAHGRPAPTAAAVPPEVQRCSNEVQAAEPSVGALTYQAQAQVPTETVFALVFRGDGRVLVQVRASDCAVTDRRPI